MGQLSGRRENQLGDRLQSLGTVSVCLDSHVVRDGDPAAGHPHHEEELCTGQAGSRLPLGCWPSWSGFGMRTVITGSVPVCNMYESVIFAAVGVAMLGFICELVYRQKYVLTVAAAIATVVLLLADSFPGVLDPSLQSLQPVLRSNFWLVAHVTDHHAQLCCAGTGLGDGKRDARLLSDRVGRFSRWSRL